jgi:hypothetical protein
MGFAFIKRWWGRPEARAGSCVDLSCGGRVSLRERDDGFVLAVTTAPDEDGRSYAAAVPISASERAELSQALGIGFAQAS